MPYLGRGPNFGVRTVFHFLASNGDTSVSGADADGKNLNFADGNYIDVYLNGVRLKLDEDFNTSTANTVAGLSALNANDEVNIVVYDTFTVADTVKASEGGTFGGAVAVTATTASSSATTGALTVSGGAGIAADLSVGDDLRLISDSAVLSFGADSDTTLTHTDGTGLTLNGANKITFRDTGLTIGSNADGDLDIVSDGTAVDSINIESAGGITLDAGTAGSGIIYEDDGTEMMRIHNSSSDVIMESKVSDKDIIFKGNDGGTSIEAMRIDMSGGGRLGIGTTDIDAPIDIVDATEYIRVANTASDDTSKSGGLAIRHRDNEEEDVHVISGIAGSSQNIVNIGGSDFIGSLNAANTIAFFTTSTRTTVDGTLHSRMDRFAATDSLSVGRTAVGYNPGAVSTNNRQFGFHAGGHRYYHPAMMVEDYDSSTQYSTTLIQFFRNGSDVGEITATTSTQYSTSSDYRLKKDIVDLDAGIDTIKKLKPRKYKWKSNDSYEAYGFIAHEIEEAIPGANDMGIVNGEKDKVEKVTDGDGKETTQPKHQGVDYAKLTPILTKGLQEAVARIEVLETKVAALEGG